MIADEAHNMGSNQLREKLPYVNILRRIGLSATPSRQFDFEGNRIIEEFLELVMNIILLSIQWKKPLKMVCCVGTIIILIL